jgi:aminoglycoside 3-N-acetyltransferase
VKLVGKLAQQLKHYAAIIVTRLITRLNDFQCTSPESTIPAYITLDGIQSFMRSIGVRDGSTVFIHSSWDNLNNGNFRAAELIKMLHGLVGVQGTLAMPAIPNLPQVSGAVFDVGRTSSAAGLLTEIFRRYPGVSRSINLNHSVCAIGAHAEFLTCDHHRSETSWDTFSPYYRLREIEEAWIIGLGVGHQLKIATSLHCVESALWKENAYFRKLFRNDVCYSYKTLTNEIGQHCFKRRSGQIYTPKLAKFFTTDELIEDTIDGLDVYAIRAQTLIDKAIDLGRKGKTMYFWPIPWRWYF